MAKSSPEKPKRCPSSEKMTTGTSSPGSPVHRGRPATKPPPPPPPDPLILVVHSGYLRTKLWTDRSSSNGTAETTQQKALPKAANQTSNTGQHQTGQNPTFGSTAAHVGPMSVWQVRDQTWQTNSAQAARTSSSRTCYQGTRRTANRAQPTRSPPQQPKPAAPPPLLWQLLQARRRRPLGSGRAAEAWVHQHGRQLPDQRPGLHRTQPMLRAQHLPPRTDAHRGCLTAFTMRRCSTGTTC